MERQGFYKNNSTPKRYTALDTKLMRTEDAKYVNYFGDGSGRDTYVVLNNGGQTTCDKKFMLRRPFKNT